MRKNDLCPTALCAIALETINTSYPPDEWLSYLHRWFNLDFIQGAGVFCDLFSFYSHVCSHATHYDGEIEAIHLALHQLSARLSTPDEALILSDSISAIQALASNQGNSSRVQDCRELLSRISTKVVFQWVPSHCGLWEKEMVVLLAKRATDILQSSTRPASSLSET
ncbi:RNase H domain-containing protein [Trichonephila clavipes]|nr:RNase H domain-containing protein [Trichonephila clavipes]